MSHPSQRSVSSALDDLWNALVRAVRAAGQTLASMSWPALLLACLGAALLIAILPLALTLFVVFMLAKLVASTWVGRDDDRGPATPYRPVTPNGQATEEPKE